MATHDERLQRHFRELSDAALLHRIDSGDLTEAARRAALAETKSRALDLGAARARAAAEAAVERDAARPLRAAFASTPAVDAEPGAGGSDTTGSAPPRAAFMSWGELVAWLYFAVYLAALTFVALVELRLSHRATATVAAMYALNTALDVVCCLGYWGWLQRRRVAVRALWVVCAAAKSVLAIDAVVVAVAARDVRQFLLIGLVLPMVVVLWRYALARNGPWREPKWQVR